MPSYKKNALIYCICVESEYEIIYVRNYINKRKYMLNISLKNEIKANDLAIETRKP